MMRSLLCSFLLLFVAVANAQPPAYNFNAVTANNFTPITGGVAVSYLFNGSANSDDGYATIPIGFTFNYNGTNYTNVSVCANGFVSFQTIPTNTDTWTNGLGAVTPATGFTAVPRPILAPLWDDMDNSPAGNTTYVVTGSAPGRILTIQWLNTKWQYSATSAVMSYQLKLYETSNIIEFAYRQEAGTPSNAGNGDFGASIGISGTATSSFIALTSSGSNPTVSTSADPANITSKPATGQVYMFDRYCAARGLFLTGGEKISRVVFNTIDNSTTSDAEYENFTNLSTSVQPSNAYGLSVYLANSYSGDHVVVYIDYNNNGVFTDAGETVYSSPNSAGPFLNIPISIPAGATLGYTRMRVRLDDAGSPGSNPASCGDAAWGQVEDYTINIANCAAASITTQPANVSICNTSNGSVTVAASGTGLNYQWQLSTNGGASWGNVPAAAPYSGTTTNTLTITGATTSMNGYMYRVLITGTCSPLVTSSASTLTVTTPATFTLNPTNTTACVGTTASFTAAANGTTPTFQWQVSTDGGATYSNINGATSATLTLTNVTSSQSSNRYRAVATVAGCGSVNSTAAVLTVNNVPTVTLAAAPVTAVKPGVSTTLTATSNPAAAAGGYAWTLNGSPVPGATTNTLVAGVSGIGTYTVRVTDVNGCQNTSAAVVITADPSDKFYIYPNPSTGRFQIRLYAAALSDIRSFTIYNAAGVKILQKEFTVKGRYDEMDFDLSGVPPGVYTIHMEQRYNKRRVVGQILIVR